MLERLAAVLILAVVLALGAAVIAAIQIRQTGWVRGGKLPEDAAPHLKRLKLSAATAAACLTLLGVASLLTNEGAGN